MKSNVKELWLKALRSDKYRFGKGVLHSKSTGRTCCMGVLIDVLRKANLGPLIEEVEPETPPKGTKITAQRYQCLHERPVAATLPSAVQDFVGLSDTEVDQLYYLNDAQGANYSEIANWIETHITGELS